MSRALRHVLPLAAALLIASVPGRAPAADDDLAAGARIVFEELEAWDLPAARAAVAELTARDAEAAAVQQALARVRFEEGDYAGAAGIYDALGARGELADIARAAAKETKGYESRESAHFVIYYRPGKDAVLAPYALEALEKQRAALQADLGWVPPGKVRVEVFDDGRALSRVSTLPLEAIKTSGTVAICKFNRLMITSPKALVRGYDWLDTLAHEYVHLVVSQMSRNTVPIWLHEGIAKYFETSWRGKAGEGLSPASAALLAEALKKDKLIPFERMHPSIALLPSQEDAALAYAEVFTAIEYMFGKGGKPLLARMIDELKRGARHDQAVAKAMGIPFAQFQRDWKAYLATREYPKETLSLSAEKLKFREDDARAKAADATKDPKLQEELRFGEFLEIEDPEGRKLAHLGELLRTRGRNKAAIEEFAKAHARIGNRSPALSNRYAQALIQVGDLPTAERLLRASLVPFPGFPKTHQNLAEIFTATNRPLEAERAWLEVVGIDPFDPLPHAGLVKIYSDRKDALRSEREKAALAILMKQRTGPMPDQGVIVVRSHPFARVHLDGTDTGRSTPTQLLVPPGSHVVKLVNDERGIARESKVDVGAGEEKVIELVLENEPDAGNQPPPAKP